MQSLQVLWPTSFQIEYFQNIIVFVSKFKKIASIIKYSLSYHNKQLWSPFLQLMTKQPRNPFGRATTIQPWPCYCSQFPCDIIYLESGLVKAPSTVAGHWALQANGHQKAYKIFHVYCILYSCFMCQTTVIFGIAKDGSLLLNTLASWNCFTCRNLFQNGANDMSEF